MSPKANTRILTLERNDYWSLKDGNEYLYSSSNSYNYLKSKKKKDADCYLSFKFSTEDKSVFAEFFNSGVTHNILGCNANNETQYGIVSCYSKDSYPNKHIWFYVHRTTNNLNENVENIQSSLVAGVQNVSVTRTFHKGGWNTWCMPFDVSQEKLKAVLGCETVVSEYKSVSPPPTRSTMCTWYVVEK